MIENRYITVDQAAKLKCPIARTFDEGKGATCDGPSASYGAGVRSWRAIHCFNPQ